MTQSLIYLWLLLLAPLSSALDFAGSDGRFLINNRTRGLMTLNGIWYYLSNSTTDIAAMDPLTDAESCTRDAALMSDLGLNLIYVDNFDPDLNHDDCFSIFNSVGIYIVIVLRSMLFTGDPNVDSYYTLDAMTKTFTWIDALKDYENLLSLDVGIFPRIEVLDLAQYAQAQRVYRAIIRDTREYVKHNSPRPILIGGTLSPFEDGNMTITGIYDFQTCIIPDETLPSSAEFISFFQLNYLEYDAIGYANKTMRGMAAELENSTTPTWWSGYGTSGQNGTPDFEVWNETLQETALLYNSTWEIIMPYGPLSGGARVSWTNVQATTPPVNWYITIMDTDGNMRLTDNYDTLRNILAEYNTDSWISGQTVIGGNQQEPPECKAELIVNVTSSIGSTRTLSLATEWNLPTRPAGLDAVITSGADGKRGQMVDVIVTTIKYEIKDSKGDIITNMSLSPSKSQARSTTGAGTSSPTPGGSSDLSVGAKAGIGIGVSIGGIALLAGIGFFLLRRHRNKKTTVARNGKGGAESDGMNAKPYEKAELAAGPGAEVEPSAELPASAINQTPTEMPGDTLKTDGFPGIHARMDEPPTELPAFEHAQELPTQQSLAQTTSEGQNNNRNRG